jgi:hypothetical protein
MAATDGELLDRRRCDGLARSHARFRYGRRAGRVKPAAEVFDGLEAKYQGQAKDKGQ